mgnify:CR=1 FL=1
MRLRQIDESRYVTVNNKLNPAIWDHDALKPDVAAALKKIAAHWEEFIGVDLDAIDLTITGSNANYTWTSQSDLDLHVIVRGEPTEEQRELYNAKKDLWAAQHEVTVKGLPVEVYVQGVSEPHHSTGVYSLAKNKWLVEPKKVKPDVDDAAVQAKLQDLQSLVQRALTNSDLNQVNAVRKRVTQMRKAGLERAGEWSVENIVFKQLRNAGLIDSITQHIRDLEDQELSIDEQSLD